MKTSRADAWAAPASALLPSPIPGGGLSPVVMPGARGIAAGMFADGGNPRNLRRDAPIGPNPGAARCSKPAHSRQPIRSTLKRLPGAIGLDVGYETAGACRGAGFLVKPLANSSCERQQLRSGGLSPANSTPFRACAGGDGVAITGSRVVRVPGNNALKRTELVWCFPCRSGSTG